MRQTEQRHAVGRIVDARERHAEGVGEVQRGEGVAGGTAGDDATLAKEHDPVGARREVEVMGGDERGTTSEQAEQTRAGCQIEVVCRLVEDEQARTSRETPGEVRALALASRECVHRPPAIEIDGHQSAVHIAAAQRHQLADGQVEREGRLLEQTRDFPGLGADKRCAVDAYGSVSWQQTRDGPERGRLSAAVGAEDRHGLAVADVKVDAVHDYPPTQPDA